MHWQEVIVNADPVPRPCALLPRRSNCVYSRYHSRTHSPEMAAGRRGDYFILDSNAVRLVSPGCKPAILLLSLVPGFENIVALRPMPICFVWKTVLRCSTSNKWGKTNHHARRFPCIRLIEAADGGTVLPDSSRIFVLTGSRTA